MGKVNNHGEGVIFYRNSMFRKIQIPTGNLRQQVFKKAALIYYFYGNKLLWMQETLLMQH